MKATDQAVLPSVMLVRTASGLGSGEVLDRATVPVPLGPLPAG